MAKYPRISIGLFADSMMLSNEDLDIVRGIINAHTGELRASKPPVPRRTRIIKDANGWDRHEYQDHAGELAGMTAYVWRMVAFMISPDSRHHCMPSTVDFDLPGSGNERRAMAKRLDVLAGLIVDSVPKSEWHGIIRWGQAFGQIGTPRYNEEGAVIYR